MGTFTLTPKQAARVANLSRFVQVGGKPMTEPMNRNRWTRLEKQVMAMLPPGTVLEPKDLRDRAKALLSIEMIKLSARSSAKRHEKAARQAHP